MSRPENTAAALQHAMNLGLSGVEVDVWPTQDQGFVLLHDADISALTGGGSWPTHLSQAEMESLDIGSRFGGDFSEERVLSLEQALRMVNGRVEFLLELKRTRHDEPSMTWIEERLAGLLHMCSAVDWVTVVSFDHRTLRKLKSLAPEIRVGMLYAGEWLTLWEEVAHVTPDAMLPHWAQTTPELVRNAHSQGLSVFPWVVNQDYVLSRMRAIGVDGIITDFPERYIEATPATRRSDDASTEV